VPGTNLGDSKLEWPRMHRSTLCREFARMARARIPDENLERWPNGGLQSARMMPSPLCSASRSGNLISVERPIRGSLSRSYPQLLQLPQVEHSSGKADLEPLANPARESRRPVVRADVTVDIPPFVSRSFGNPHLQSQDFAS
jgi:hypothetical protein